MPKWTMLALKLSISAALLYLAVRKIDFVSLWARLDADSFRWLSVAVAMLLMQVVVGAIRWARVSKLSEAPISLSQATRFNVIGSFFNQTLPSSIGGDAVRLMLVRHQGAGWRAATYSVVVDRAIGLITLAVIVVLSLPWSLRVVENFDGRVALVAIDLAALAAGIAFLGFGSLSWRILKTWRITHHLQACSLIARCTLGGSRGVGTLLLSALIHIMIVAAAWCVARSINAPVSFMQMLILLPPVLLISMLPVSVAGWGVRETAMMVAFEYAGLLPESGVNVSLIFGLVMFIAGAIGGLVWICTGDKDSLRQSSRP